MLGCVFALVCVLGCVFALVCVLLCVLWYVYMAVGMYVHVVALAACACVRGVCVCVCVCVCVRVPTLASLLIDPLVSIVQDSAVAQRSLLAACENHQDHQILATKDLAQADTDTPAA